MPALTYPTADFQPFTKILSAEVNGKFNAIRTLLNTTKLDHSNLQTGNLLYASQTSLQIVGTGSTGLMTTQAVVLVGQGGTGFSFSPVLADSAKVLQVNTVGSALTFDVVPLSPVPKVLGWSWYT